MIRINPYRATLRWPHQLPELPNAWPKNPHAENRRRKKWHKRVGEMILVSGVRPTETVTRCELACVRWSPRMPDFDGLVQSFKPLVDGLVNHEIIADDHMGIIVRRRYSWVQVPKKYQEVTMEISQIVV